MIDYGFTKYPENFVFQLFIIHLTAKIAIFLKSNLLFNSLYLYCLFCINLNSLNAIISVFVICVQVIMYLSYIICITVPLRLYFQLKFWRNIFSAITRGQPKEAVIFVQNALHKKNNPFLANVLTSHPLKKIRKPNFFQLFSGGIKWKHLPKTTSLFFIFHSVVFRHLFFRQVQVFLCHFALPKKCFDGLLETFNTFAAALKSNIKKT